jgi:hypothetical protein
MTFKLLHYAFLPLFNFPQNGQARYERSLTPNEYLARNRKPFLLDDM